MPWGPYALLVRDAALPSQETSNHDYLDTPEIVEDICQSFEDRFGLDLLRACRAATHLCLVRFVSDIPRPDIVPIALAYARAALRAERLTRWENACYEGAGCPATQDRITRIEFLATDACC